MAPKPQESGLDLDTRDENTVAHDFVYNPEMTIDRVSEHLKTDWEDAYNTLNDLLNQVDDDE